MIGVIVATFIVFSFVCCLIMENKPKSSNKEDKYLEDAKREIDMLLSESYIRDDGSVIIKIDVGDMTDEEAAGVIDRLKLKETCLAPNLLPRHLRVNHLES